jgi:hypothetical protein
MYVLACPGSMICGQEAGSILVSFSYKVKLLMGERVPEVSMTE